MNTKDQFRLIEGSREGENGFTWKFCLLHFQPANIKIYSGTEYAICVNTM